MTCRALAAAPRLLGRQHFGGWGWDPMPARKVQQPQIIRALLADDALLAMPDASIVADIRSRFGVSRVTAYRAVWIARKKQPVDSLHVEHSA